jgi:hypothetical protein
LNDQVKEDLLSREYSMIEDKRNACRIWEGKPERKGPLGLSRSSLKSILDK